MMETEKPAKVKSKSKTKKHIVKAKTSKKTFKKLCEGPTCSIFLTDLTKKLQMKKKREENEEMGQNIIDSIIDKLSSSFSIRVTKKALVKPDTAPVKIEDLAPELVPKDQIQGPVLQTAIEEQQIIVATAEASDTFVIPEGQKPGKMKMPVINSDILKPKPKVVGSMHDMAMNTGDEHNVADELEKHVITLKKISLIAEELNQKTARSLQKIVESVQKDLIKKLEEAQREQQERDALESELNQLQALFKEESIAQ